MEQRSTEHKLWWNTIQLNAARKSLALHDNLLKHRLVDVYEHGDMGYLSVLHGLQIVHRFRGALGGFAAADRRQSACGQITQGRGT